MRYHEWIKEMLKTPVELPDLASCDICGQQTLKEDLVPVTVYTDGMLKETWQACPQCE